MRSQWLESAGQLFAKADETFHSAVHRQVDYTILDEIPQRAPRDCPPFSKRELLDCLKASTDTAPGEDHL